MSQPIRKILLVYPAFPITYWGLGHALPVLGKKAFMPPLGLITVAAMFPEGYEFRLTDLNCETLESEDLEWADAAFLSAMLPQKQTLFEAAAVCRAAGLPVFMGGPYPTANPEECRPHADVLVRGEAEAIWPQFMEDLAVGRPAADYGSDIKPDITSTPVPRFDLLKMEYYLSVPVQYSRGCPFQCEFCDIIVMYGRKPRVKSPEQVLRELDAVRAAGYRGEVFIVDDNFIGNKKAVKKLLPEMARWNAENGAPFTFGTEASVDLSGETELMEAMTRARFRWVFLGIETPSRESLNETLKLQNLRGSLEDTIGVILDKGLHVTAGFIIGFDNDKEDIFDRQLDFISRTAVPFAMVGLLHALAGTPLHARMQKEGRLISHDMDEGPDHIGHTNIRTLLPEPVLLNGYRRVVATVYDPKNYFERAFQTLLRFKRAPTRWGRFKTFLSSLSSGLPFFMPGKSNKRGLFAGMNALRRYMSAMEPDFKRESRRLFRRVLRHRPDQIMAVLDYSIVGHHFYRLTNERVLPSLDASIARLPRAA